jgi:hypothetical protein
MPRSRQHSIEENKKGASASPVWITEALIERTIQVWQPRCSYTITRADAIALLVNVARLCDVLGAIHSNNGLEKKDA